MKLIEHLEHVLGLVERSAPYAEINGALIAMHEEVAGAQRAAENQADIAEKYARLEQEHAALKKAHSELKNPATKPETALERMSLGR